MPIFTDFRHYLVKKIYALFTPYWTLSGPLYLDNTLYFLLLNASYNINDLKILSCYF